MVDTCRSVIRAVGISSGSDLSMLELVSVYVSFTSPFADMKEN